MREAGFFFFFLVVGVDEYSVCVNGMDGMQALNNHGFVIY